METGISKTSNIIIHNIGNKLREEGMILSNQEVPITEQIEELILSGYLKSISLQGDPFSFYHESDLRLNEIYSFSREIFSKRETFIQNSVKIAQHLYSKSDHPNISAGEIVVILFDDLTIGDIRKSAIGIFKSETRNDIFEVTNSNKSLQIQISSGINPTQIDKGALIIEGEENLLYTIDRFSKKTKYWIESFLKARPIQNEKITVKIAEKLITELVNSTSNHNTKKELKEALSAQLNDKENGTIEDIAYATKKIIPEEHVADILKKIEAQYGFEIDERAEIKTKKILGKITKTFSTVTLTKDITLKTTKLISIEDVKITTDADGTSIAEIKFRSKP